MKIENLSFGFHSAQGSFDAEVAAGSLVFIAGANGSGKTTLLKTLAGLLEPLGGGVKTPARPLYLPAHPEVTDWLTASDVFDIFGGWPTHGDLAALDVQKILEHPLHRLSLGEQKKIFLAAALAAPTNVLLLDEPLNSLDWNMELALAELISRRLRSGKTFLIAAHQLPWMAKFPHARLWFLRRFSLVKSGPMEEVLTSPEVQEIFNFRVAFADNPLDGSRILATSELKHDHET
jgi:iron complex transport system ATP-binding protein